jgi:transposase
MTATAITSLGGETEVTEKAERRSFTVEYKRRIVKETDACKAPGEIGALLRREGLYSSQLATWRVARDRGDLAPGAATKKRGPKAAAVDPRDKKIAELERQNAKLTTRAERAEAIAEIQKNSRVRPGRPPVRPETPAVASMAGREEWPPAFWCSANP